MESPEFGVKVIPPQETPEIADCPSNAKKGGGLFLVVLVLDYAIIHDDLVVQVDRGVPDVRTGLGLGRLPLRVDVHPVFYDGVGLGVPEVEVD